MSRYIELHAEYNQVFYKGLEAQYTWYSKAGNLRDAVEKAFFSIDENGGLNPHQHRIGKGPLKEAAEKALKVFDTKHITTFKDFESIYEFVGSIGCKVTGVGELAIYDVAVRIAKYLKLKVRNVYLHRGATVGARALGKNVKDGKILSVDKFPPPLNQLSGDHLENFLCIYKHELAHFSTNAVKSCKKAKAHKHCGSMR